MPNGYYTTPTHINLEDSCFVGLLPEGEIAFNLTCKGKIQFFHAETGKKIDNSAASIPLPPNQRIAHVTSTPMFPNNYTVFFEQGDFIVFEVDQFYKKIEGAYQNAPHIAFPYGEIPTTIPKPPLPFDNPIYASSLLEEGIVIALQEGKRIQVTHLELSDEGFEVLQHSLFEVQRDYKWLLLTEGYLHLLSEKGEYSLYKLTDFASPEKHFSVQLPPLSEDGKAIANLSDADFLLGNFSLITTHHDGSVHQWFILPSQDDPSSKMVKRVRSFQAMPDSYIIPSQNSRSFFTVSKDGHMKGFNTTSNIEFLSSHYIGQFDQLIISQHINYLLAYGKDQIALFKFSHSDHPEISFESLWQSVWYENYPEPKYIWQSSSANHDFEPKFGLMPLWFGTLKAALYAMLFSIPIAILGALYTAYFMSETIRNWVKPTVELMAALPTVIIGFLAGLWLAPVIEKYLLGVFLLFILLPLSFPLAGWCMQHARNPWRHYCNEKYFAILLIPVLIIVGYFCLSIGQWLDPILFETNLKTWLTNSLGIKYDQRNAVVIGIALGLAVIPLIFSISEDAIRSVPQKLTQGSLALGATHWQTLIYVVLPTASPGIFSALMIGLGRAVGETMIVLMATGNTPIMDWSAFQGMRTFSANIAVELPESEINSSHYRILFLSALVLFALTFTFNTISEVVRQRLRNRYGSR